MIARRLAGPEPAVTLEQAKAALRVDFADDDALIGDLIGAASEHVEVLAGVAFGRQTWRLTLDAFPRGRLALSVGPLAEVISVTHGPDAALLDATSYRLAGDGLEAVTTWPAGSGVVEYVAGLGWPADMRRAVTMIVAHWYRQAETMAEEGAAQEVPYGATDLIARRRRMGA